MNPDRWQAVGDLFEQALEMPAPDRTGWVRQASQGDEELHREVRSLLASHEQAAGGFFQDKVRTAVVAFHATSLGEQVHAGPYRLVRELGRGGMGTVYLAERDDDEYRSQVAVKVVRPGMDTDFILARFRRERQTLARLQHPNIARLLDGGTAENGLPYIVMEYIDGPRLNEWVGTRNLGIEERLGLFLKVCSAVDYAHRNFVVHRDLKPGNILVNSYGVPKLLDFGICKLLQADALASGETVEAPMTPDYASPEQVNGDPVTPLSDVYSLGIVLYELLTGALPRRFEKTGAYGVTVSQAPIRRPGSIDRRLCGDLDTIILHALETEPDRRYQSVAELAADLRRHLAHVPVSARPQTLGYRAGKFVRRNRGAVASGAVVLLALAAGLAVSLYEVHVARLRLDQVRALADRLVVDVHDAVRDLPGATRARQLIVQTGLEYLDSVAGAARGNAAAERGLAAAYRKLGDAQGYVVASNLGNTAAALASYRKAMTLLNDAVRAAPDDLASHTERLIVFERQGSVQAGTGQLRDAVRTFEDGLRTAAQFSPSGPDVRDWKSALASLHLQASEARRNMSDNDGALHDAAESLRLYQEAAAAGESPELTHSLASAYQAVGMMESRLNRLPEALGHARQGAAAMEKLVDANPGNDAWRRDLMLAYGHVADALGSTTLASLGDTAGALEYYRKAAGIGRAIYTREPDNFRAVTDYGIALSRVASTLPEGSQERLEAARQSLGVLEAAARINPGNVGVDLYRAIVNQTIGTALVRRGDLAGAVQAFTEGGLQAERGMKLGQTASLVVFISGNRQRAALAVTIGDRAEALRHANAALNAGQKPGTSPRLTTPRALAVMGFTYAALANSKLREAGDLVEANSWLEKSLEAWRAAQSDPIFNELHRREMREVESALATLGKKP